MSEPTPQQNEGEYIEELKRECANEAGLIVVGHNTDGEIEFLGSDEKWKEYNRLLEDKLNEL